jgi:hypothetical protein
MLFSVSKRLIETLEQGKTYDRISKIFSVNIIYFELGVGEDYVYRGSTSFQGIHKKDTLKLSAIQRENLKRESICEIYPEYFLICINKFKDMVLDTFDQWVYFLKNEEVEEYFDAKGLRAAKEKLDILKLSPEDRAKYDRYIEDRRHQMSVMDSTIVRAEKAEALVEEERRQKENAEALVEEERRQKEEERRQKEEERRQKEEALSRLNTVVEALVASGMSREEARRILKLDEI